MNKKMIMLVLLSVVGICLNSSSVGAQCTEKLPEAPSNGGFIKARDETNEEIKQIIEEEKKYTHIYAKFDTKPNTRPAFKVALDSDVSGGFAKTNDNVVFTVLENVYGSGEITDTVAGKDGKPLAINMRKRCVIIPKDTKIYGLVYHANSRYPFNIGGKGKLFITISRVKLEDGTEFKIKFTEHPDNVAIEGKVKGATRDCRKDKSRKCITGRRTKLTLPTTAIASGTTTGLLIVKDEDTTAAIAGLTFLESLSKVTGVDNLVNPPNAELKSKMVFDVELEEGYTGVWVPLKAEKPAETTKTKTDK